jgi:hypothetical protein
MTVSLPTAGRHDACVELNFHVSNDRPLLHVQYPLIKEYDLLVRSNCACLPVGRECGLRNCKSEI